MMMLLADKHKNHGVCSIRFDSIEAIAVDSIPARRVCKQCMGRGAVCMCVCGQTNQPNNIMWCMPRDRRLRGKGGAAAAAAADRSTRQILAHLHGHTTSHCTTEQRPDPPPTHSQSIITGHARPGPARHTSDGAACPRIHRRRRHHRRRSSAAYAAHEEGRRRRLPCLHPLRAPRRAGALPRVLPGQHPPDALRESLRRILGLMESIDPHPIHHPPHAPITGTQTNTGGLRRRGGPAGGA